jgi:Mg-chelatase subunit ChlD
MAWFRPEKPWKKKSEVSNIRETQVGSNSYRINVVRKGEEADKTVSESKDRYLAAKELRKLNSKHFRSNYEPRPMRSYADLYANEDYYNQEFEAAGYSTSYRTRGIATYKAPVAVKKDFAWAPTRWSNFNTFFTAYSDDDDSNLFIKEPESYLTPTALEIRQKIHVVKKESIDMIKDLCRLFYFKMLDDSSFIEEEKKNTMDHETFSKKKEMYTTLYNSFIPGYTPLEQATNYYQTILDKEAVNNTKKHAGDRGNEITIFKREDFSNPALNTQLDMNSLSAGRKMNILNKISLIGELGQQFMVEKETGEKVVANSDVYRKKVMRDYSQMDRINTYQTLFPNYEIKFITKNLIVDVPVQVGEKKQKIIILLDYSGSMNNTEKQIWVNAILIDRFRYVIKGEAEIYISNFVSRADDLHFQHVKNAEDVEKFWKTFSNYPSGGGTDMGRIVRYVAEQVKGGKTLKNLNVNLSFEKPEILIINDGQDSVGSSAFPYKVNAISLMQFSSELKTLCVNTGGKQVRVSSDNSIISYSSEGEKVVKE